MPRTYFYLPRAVPLLARRREASGGCARPGLCCGRVLPCCGQILQVRPCGPCVALYRVLSAFLRVSRPCPACIPYAYAPAFLGVPVGCPKPSYGLPVSHVLTGWHMWLSPTPSHLAAPGGPFLSGRCFRQGNPAPRAFVSRILSLYTARLSLPRKYARA